MGMGLRMPRRLHVRHGRASRPARDVRRGPSRQWPRGLVGDELPAQPLARRARPLLGGRVRPADRDRTGPPRGPAPSRAGGRVARRRHGRDPAAMRALEDRVAAAAKDAAGEGTSASRRVRSSRRMIARPSWRARRPGGRGSRGRPVAAGRRREDDRGQARAAAFVHAAVFERMGDVDRAGRDRSGPARAARARSAGHGRRVPGPPRRARPSRCRRRRPSRPRCRRARRTGRSGRPGRCRPR